MARNYTRFGLIFQYKNWYYTDSITTDAIRQRRMASVIVHAPLSEISAWRTRGNKL